MTIAAWFGLPPALVLLVLTADGALLPWQGLGCLGGVSMWSLLAGVVFARDLTRLDSVLTNEPKSDIRLVTPGLNDVARAVTRALGRAREAERRSHEVLAVGAGGGVGAIQRLLERLPDALFHIEGPRDARRIAWRNPAAARIYGPEESALLRHPALRAALIEAESGDAPVRTAFTLAAPMVRDLDATTIPTGRHVGERSLYLLLSDRTRERALDRMRADFVANASHELRTPLTSLVGFIETLQGPAQDDGDARRRFLAIMGEQASRMQRTIDDLLNLSRIEMTEHQPPVELIELEPVLREVSGFMAPVLQAGNSRLTLDIPRALPSLYGDPRQLTQLFGNLIENAVKYGALKHGGSGGTILLLAEPTPAADHPHAGVLVSVIDDGPGIAREHLPRLTERFYRVDKGRSRAVGGTGLGLAIAKHVVARHRGRLTIESIEGEGTSCLVWLPAAAAPGGVVNPGRRV